MSLNKFTDTNIKPWMKIGCDAVSCNSVTTGSLVAITDDLNISSDLEFTNQSLTPSNPSPGSTLLYSKNDSKMYSLDSTGLETELGGGGGGNPFDQNLNTTDSVEFSEVKSNELNNGLSRIVDLSSPDTIDLQATNVLVNGSPIQEFDQDLNTTDDVQFNTIETTEIANGLSRAISLSTADTIDIQASNVLVNGSPVQNFNQDLNTTDDVTFNNVTATGTLFPEGTVVPSSQNVKIYGGLYAGMANRPVLTGGYTSTGDVFLNNTGVETDFIPTGFGSLTTGANVIKEGSTSRSFMAGDFSSGGNNQTILFRLKINGTTVNSFQVDLDTADNKPWQLNTLMVCKTQGLTGTMYSNSVFTYTKDNNLDSKGSGSSGSFAINTNIVNTFSITAQWLNVTPDNKITCKLYNTSNLFQPL